MTPEEARETDRQEFEADCRAARTRAYALVEKRRSEHADLVKRCARFRSRRGVGPRWAVPFVPFYTPPAALALSPVNVRADAPTLTFRGDTHTLTQWSRRTGLSLSTIRSRVAYGWDAERILTVPPGAQMGRPKRSVDSNPTPGVASNFSDISATGAPRHARDFSQLEISE